MRLVLVSITDPLGNSAIRFPDQLGRIASITDPNGSTTKYKYDNANQITAILNPEGYRASLAYDANGDLVSVQDFMGHTTQFAYDVMDRMATRTDPLGRVTSVTYDLAGNPVAMTDPKGQVTSRTFDGIGREIFVGYGTTTGQSGPQYQGTISYQYDRGNRLTSATDSASGSISRGYNAFNEVTSETTPQGSISYGYDADERLVSAQVEGGTQIQYNYDDANRVISIVQGSADVGFSYDDANRRTTLTLPNGVTVHYGYDQDSHVDSISYAEGSTSIGNLTYSYDANGNRVEVGGTLAATNMPSALSAATYDADNELTSWGGIVPAYNANGEMTTDVSGNHYSWNARGQLVSITGASNVTFGYDAFGRRVTRTVGANTTAYQYEGLSPITETTSGMATSLLPGGLNEYYQRTDSTGDSVPLSDALGSIIGMTNSSGALATTYWYGPYGGTTVSGAESSNDAQFTGQENDGTGLYYFRARYYNPEIARFISQDPMGMRAGLNLYLYANDSPMVFTDPSGQDSISGAITGGIFGGLGAWSTTGGDFWATVAGGIAGVGVGALAGGGLLPPNPFNGAAEGAAGDYAGQVVGNLFNGEGFSSSFTNINGGEIAGAAFGGATGAFANQGFDALAADAGGGFGSGFAWGKDILGGIAGMLGGDLGNALGCQR